MQYDWLFCGDTSRYIFLDWLMQERHESAMEQEDIEVVFSADAGRGITQEGLLRIGTNRILPGQRIFIPCRGDILPADAKTAYRHFACFETQPFCREDTSRFLQDEEDTLMEKSYVLVLMAPERAHLRTDRDTPETALSKAKAVYEENRIPVLVLRQKTDMLQLISWRDDSISHEIRQIGEWCRQDREYLHQNFESSFRRAEDSLKDQENGVLSIKKKDSYTSYALSLKRYIQQYPWRGDLWKIYRWAASCAFFDEKRKGGIQAILECYEELTDDSLHREECETRKRKLQQALRCAWEKDMAVPSEFSGKDAEWPKTEDAYLRLIAEDGVYGGIHVAFIQRLEEFVSVTSGNVLRDLLEKEIACAEERLRRYGTRE